MRMDGSKRCEMADLRCRSIVHEGGAAGVAVEPRAVLAAVGTHTTECLACCTRLQRSDMAEYCYGYYRVTGDSTTKKNPRHPHTLCGDCLKGYAVREAEAGKLHIKCPSCPRSLQMRECRELIGKELFEELVKRVAQAEKRLHGGASGGEGDDDDSVLLAAGLQCRSCPKCGTRIEKNAGCDEMDCYLCGHHFVWQKAAKIKQLTVRKQQQPGARAGTTTSGAQGGAGRRSARDGGSGGGGNEESRVAAARSAARATARDAAVTAAAAGGQQQRQRQQQPGHGGASHVGHDTEGQQHRRQRRLRKLAVLV